MLNSRIFWYHDFYLVIAAVVAFLLAKKQLKVVSNLLGSLPVRFKQLKNVVWNLTIFFFAEQVDELVVEVDHLTVLLNDHAAEVAVVDQSL